GGCPWQGSAHEVSRRALRFRRKLLEHRDPGWGVGGLAVDGDQVADLVDHPPYRGRGLRLDGVIELAKPQRREGRLLIPGIADRTLAIRHPNGAHVSTTSAAGDSDTAGVLPSIRSAILRLPTICSGVRPRSSATA